MDNLEKEINDGLDRLELDKQRARLPQIWLSPTDNNLAFTRGCLRGVLQTLPIKTTKIREVINESGRTIYRNIHGYNMSHLIGTAIGIELFYLAPLTAAFVTAYFSGLLHN